MKFVDVKNDVAFHKIFGNAHKTITLISFLNAVMQLEGESKVLSVTIENPYLYPVLHGGKTVIIDIRATDHMGRHFIVEMQVADKEGFEKRTQFYAARDYAAQIDRGEQYAELRPTHFIGILDFSISNNPNYYSHHQTIDVETGECLLKDVQYFFIELPKFKKKISTLKTMMDKWTFFIKNAENLTLIPAGVTDKGLKTAYVEADRHNWSKAELNAYYDAGAIAADHIQERIKAEQIGVQIGVEIGVEKGKMEKEMEAVLGLHENGVPISIIAKSLNLTEDRVNDIIRDEK